MPGSCDSGVNGAKKVKSHVQFSLWAAAMEEFKSTYGHFPRIDTAMSNGPGTHYLDAERFAVALTGRHLDGTPLAATDDHVDNIQRRTFYTFSETELDSAKPPHLRDAFGNTQIAVLYDTNGDGIINTADVPGGVAPTVSPVSHPERHFAPKFDLANGIHAGVIFYSAGKGESADDIVYSSQ